MPYQEPTPRTGFLRRLSYILIGIAIGFMVLGFFQQAKKRQARIDAEREALIKATPPPNDTLFPPIPKADPKPDPAPPTPPPAPPNPAQLAK
jgi:type IV secretory pathway VirB10-like protein